MTDFDALILAGGGASRMGCVDKPAVLVGGVTLLDRVLGATAGASSTVVVGPTIRTSRAVTWRREDPVGGGPVAGLAAGLDAVTAPVVVVLAADLPFLTPACVQLLVSCAPAVLMGDGRPQWLCGAWFTEDLRTAVGALDVVAGARLGGLLGSLQPAWVEWQGDDRPWTDCDTVDDVLLARSTHDDARRLVGAGGC